MGNNSTKRTGKYDHLTIEQQRVIYASRPNNDFPERKIKKLPKQIETAKEKTENRAQDEQQDIQVSPVQTRRYTCTSIPEKVKYQQDNVSRK